MTSGKIPIKPGYYWAKWRIPADGTHEGELLCPSDNWELVQVNENSVNWDKDPSEDEALSVSIPGVRETQWRDCFIWGDFVCPLEYPKPQDGPAHTKPPGSNRATGRPSAHRRRMKMAETMSGLPVRSGYAGGPKPVESARDWRIGLSAKAKYRTSSLCYEPPHKVIDVFPSGHGGISDKDGVLTLESSTGVVFLASSDEWRTA